MARAAAVRHQTPEDQQLEWYRSKVTAAMDLLDKAKAKSLRDQQYYDGIQWTQEETDILKGRNQPALTFNHVKPAVNALIGVVERGKTDPKGWGRTPKDQDAAEVATDGLRYVADTSRFNHKRLQALKQYLIWGICVGLVEVDQDGQEIGFTQARSEEYFYDPYSRELDFSDARFDGLAKWMDEADAIALAPDKEKEIRASCDQGNGISTTYEDRPKETWAWADSKSRRVMVFEMYHRKGADWHKCLFVSGAILESGPSPYKDSKGRPKKCTIAQSAYVDSDNCRYGVIRDMIGPQDAINKARSKAVHILNTRQVRVDPGIKDVDEVRKEAAKADGVFEYRQDQFEIVPTHTQFLPAHLELLRDAKAEMARQSPTPGLVGRNDASQSGRAILAEQQAGLAEQAPILAGFDDWTLRVYRSFWDAIKQFWTAPKWVRVTDDEMAPKFILMNAPEGTPQMDPKTGQPMQDQQTGQAMMAQPNRPAEMDVDIIIDSTPDTAAIQEEQFTKLAELVQGGIPIPPDVLIEASSLPKKRMLLDKLKKANEEQQGQPGPAQIEMQKAQVQLQSRQQMAELDAQAHMQELQRDDEADQRKAERQAALEAQKFQNDMARLRMQDEAANLNAQRALEMDTIKRTSEFEHATKSKQMDLDFEGKKQAASAKGKPASNDNGDDMQIVLDPKIQEAIAQSVIEKNKASQTKAEMEAQVTASGPQAIAQALAQIGNATEAIKSFADMASRPRRLVKDPVTGEKQAVLVN